MSAGNEREFIDHLWAAEKINRFDIVGIPASLITVNGKCWDGRRWAKPKCPYAITKLAGDETYEVCELNTKFCLLESGLECETYEEALKELAEEAEDEMIDDVFFHRSWPVFGGNP